MDDDDDKEENKQVYLTTDWGVELTADEAIARNLNSMKSKKPRNPKVWKYDKQYLHVVKNLISKDFRDEWANCQRTQLLEKIKIRTQVYDDEVVSYVISKAEEEYMKDNHEALYSHYCLNGMDLNKTLAEMNLPINLSNMLQKILTKSGVELLLPHEFQQSMIMKQMSKLQEFDNRIMEKMKEPKLKAYDLNILLQGLRSIHSDINDAMENMGKYPTKKEIQYSKILMLIVDKLEIAIREMVNEHDRELIINVCQSIMLPKEDDLNNDGRIVVNNNDY